MTKANCNVGVDANGATYATPEWQLRVCAPLGTPCSENIRALYEVVAELIAARQKADGPCPICGSWEPNTHLGHGCLPTFRVESEELPLFNSFSGCPKCHASRSVIAARYTPVYDDVEPGMVVVSQKQIGEYFQRTCTACQYGWKESTVHAPPESRPGYPAAIKHCQP